MPIIIKIGKFFKERKQAKMQWLQDPNQRNVGNLNNVRREASTQLTHIAGGNYAGGVRE
jgi:hypothetical protein